MRVRKATKRDLKDIEVLDRALFQEEMPLISWKTGILKAGGVDHHIVGYSCEPFWIVTYGHMQKDGFIDRIGVRPDSQKQGYGRQILKSLIATARRLGLSRVYTYMDRSNTASLILFLKSEFRTVGRVAGVRWIHMERQI